jgi:lipoyl(octanoyl) transferase
MRAAPFSSPQLCVCHLGTVPYREAIAMQQQISDGRRRGELPDVMLLLEHPPTYTRGRRSADGELPLGERVYRDRGIEVVSTDRGGKVTYHGPGQLIGYPIMHVRDVLAHVRVMEAAIIATLADQGLLAHSRAHQGSDFTGVWLEDRKIASIGVHLSGGISTHGFALNVDNDLEPFSWIIPCGLGGVHMTSIARELASKTTLAAEGGAELLTRVRERAATRFCELLERHPRLVSPLELGIQAPQAAAAEPSVSASHPELRAAAHELPSVATMSPSHAAAT